MLYNSEKLVFSEVCLHMVIISSEWRLWKLMDGECAE